MGVVAARTLLAVVVMLPFAVRGGGLREVWHRWPELVGLAALELAVPFTLISGGEQRISSSLTAILIATGPFMVAGINALMGVERIRRLAAAGLGLGLVGVVVLVGVDVGSDTRQLVGIAMIVGAVACYAVAVVWMRRRMSDVSPVGVMTVMCMAAAAMTTPFALGQLPDGVPSASVVWSLVGLGLGCTALALVIYMALIAELGGVRAMLVTYLNPVVAVVAGVLVLGESFTWAMLSGMALIGLGSWLATRPAGHTAAT